MDKKHTEDYEARVAWCRHWDERYHGKRYDGVDRYDENGNLIPFHSGYTPGSSGNEEDETDSVKAIFGPRPSSVGGCLPAPWGNLPTPPPPPERTRVRTPDGGSYACSIPPPPPPPPPPPASSSSDMRLDSSLGLVSKAGAKASGFPKQSTTAMRGVAAAAIIQTAGAASQCMKDVQDGGLSDTDYHYGIFWILLFSVAMLFLVLGFAVGYLYMKGFASMKLDPDGIEDHPYFSKKKFRRVCDLCGEYAGVPFEWCKFCERSWVHHHGRCCLHESNPLRDESLARLGLWSCIVQYLPSGTTHSANDDRQPAWSAGVALDPLPPAPLPSSSRKGNAAPPPTREECQAKAREMRVGDKTWSNKGTRSRSSSSSSSSSSTPPRKRSVHKCTQAQCSYTLCGNKFYALQRECEHGSWTDYTPADYHRLSSIREGSSTGGS